MILLYIPAGDFLMGATDAEIAQVQQTCSGCNLNEERPQHTVYLDAFWMDQTLVTNRMYAQCVQAGRCLPPSDKSSSTRQTYYGNPQFAQYPVIYVSWDDAQTYCGWAGRRLPSEAEWEKAARGTDGRLYPWGSQAPSETLVNFNRNFKDTTEVGKYPAGASPYGALDMAGNVWEWVNDWFDSNYYSTSPARNPPGPATGKFHVLRGGSWGISANGLRAAYRTSYDPAILLINVGFRCAVSPGK
jgi:serine/threonine-protein kinase